MKFSLFFVALGLVTACGVPPKIDGSLDPDAQYQSPAAAAVGDGNATAVPSAQSPQGSAPTASPPVNEMTPSAAPSPVVTPVQAPTPVGQGPAVMPAPAPAPAATPVAYNPCPKDSPCLIMPFGDSITQGSGSSAGGGYRVSLFQKITKAKKNATFVGSRKTGPAMVDGLPFPQANEGNSGYTIFNITVGTKNLNGIGELAPARLATYKPHIITLMIGTNDINNNADIEKAPERLGKLLDLIAKESPNTLIIVAQIVPTGVEAKDVKVKAYNDKIPAVVKARADAGKHIVMVDMYKPLAEDPQFPAGLLPDRLHPNDTGLAIMANVWWKVLEPILK